MSLFFHEPVQDLVSIVTVNYKNKNLSIELLESLKKSTYQMLEVILVDNESDGADRADYLEVYPDLIYLHLPQNLGFAGANNVGIVRCKGAHILLLNNDTEIEPNAISSMLQAFQSFKDIGVVSPKIKFFHLPNTIQYAGFTSINPITGRNKGIGYMAIDQGQHDTSNYTAYAHGAAMMLSRVAIEKAGLMWENFFLYYEELDWCEKIKRADLKIYYQASAVVYHKESVSVGVNSPIKIYYNTRNRIWFMKRNVSVFQYIFFVLFYILMAFPKGIISLMTHRQWKHAKSFLKGTWDGILYS
jgi:hypothetical protein